LSYNRFIDKGKVALISPIYSGSLTFNLCRNWIQ